MKPEDNTQNENERQPVEAALSSGPPAEEAECPECGEWSRVAPTGPYLVPTDDGVALVHGPWWWTDKNGDPERGPAGCPKCDAVVLVESDCCFRTSEATP